MWRPAVDDKATPSDDQKNIERRLKGLVGAQGAESRVETERRIGIRMKSVTGINIGNNTGTRMESWDEIGSQTTKSFHEGTFHVYTGEALMSTLKINSISTNTHYPPHAAQGGRRVTGRRAGGTKSRIATSVDQDRSRSNKLGSGEVLVTKKKGENGSTQRQLSNHRDDLFGIEAVEKLHLIFGIIVASRSACAESEEIRQPVASAVAYTPTTSFSARWRRVRSDSTAMTAVVGDDLSLPAAIARSTVGVDE
ncbi:hypothetical protein EVAR_20173_1 [Eumeta japonica]|uniref:Uncharacterized protein n=1 Tax=Eumeta variegata TaxID=151549 RepID=A0A4C1UVM1_EUMVA|nr:hypothetical protein EVAR_20173_1 [Eumeta japonica]